MENRAHLQMGTQTQHQWCRLPVISTNKSCLWTPRQKSAKHETCFINKWGLKLSGCTLKVSLLSSDTNFLLQDSCIKIEQNSNLLVFVQHTEGIQKGKIGSYTFKVLLRDVPIMVMVIVSKHRLQRKDKYLWNNYLWVRLWTCYWESSDNWHIILTRSLECSGK